MTALPAPFFSDLLPLVDDLAELKVLLFCFWALPQKEGRFRYLRRRDFLQNTPLMEGLTIIQPDANPEGLLDAALDRAVSRAALLRVAIVLNGVEEFLYFANTPVGRTAADQVKAGQVAPGDLENPVEILPERPSIYRLYEENIGALTPLIADELKDMQDLFPSSWLEEALGLAVQANKRSLRYIRAILERWRTEGKDEQTTRERPGEDGQRYVTGKYADFIDH